MFQGGTGTAAGSRVIGGGGGGSVGWTKHSGGRPWGQRGAKIGTESLEDRKQVERKGR
jgi:hypothetical protein